jgi:hypothetical protein
MLAVSYHFFVADSICRLNIVGYPAKETIQHIPLGRETIMKQQKKLIHFAS